MFADVEILSNNTYKYSKFTYLVPNKFHKKIKIGSIVNVDFRNRNKTAVVVKIHKESPNINIIKKIEKIVDQLSKHHLIYLKHLASANFLNIGMLLFNLYQENNFKLDNNLNENDKCILNNDKIFINIEKNKKNVIFTPSLKSAKNLYKDFQKHNIPIDFYQKTGGKDEIAKALDSKNNFQNIIVLSNNYLKIIPTNSTIYHFFNTNDFGYNLPTLNSLNIVELAVLKHHYFGGRYNFYNEFPSLNIFNTVNHYRKPNIENVYIYHGNSISECIQLLKSKYKFSTKVLTHDTLSDDNLSEFNIVKNANERFDISVLINPRIIYKNNLNSERLIYLFKKINEAKLNNKILVILSTQDLDLNSSLEEKIIQQMSNDEIKQREKWGPNLHHKVYKVLADSKLDYQNKLILGPRVIDGVYEYEININLKENINYNEIITTFRKFQNYEPKKVTSI